MINIFYKDHLKKLSVMSIFLKFTLIIAQLLIKLFAKQKQRYLAKSSIKYLRK